MKLPKKIKAKWLKALRSGTYIQTRQILYNPRSGGFCCLGVLQHCTTGGKVSGYYLDHAKKEWAWSAMPDAEFMKSIGAVGDHTSDVGGTLMRLADLNDKNRWDFKRIADWIEKNIGTTD